MFPSKFNDFDKRFDHFTQIRKTVNTAFRFAVVAWIILGVLNVGFIGAAIYLLIKLAGTL